MYLGLYFLISAILAILPASIAGRKGRNAELWWIYGVLIWIVAVLHAISLPEIENGKTGSKDLSNIASHGTLDDTRVDINALARIMNYNLLTDEQNVYFICSIYNGTEKVLNAVKIEAVGYNSFGDPIIVDGQNAFSILLQDLHIPAYNGSKVNNKFLLPDKSIRKLDLRIVQLLYQDGTIEVPQEECLIEINRNPLDSLYLEMAKKENSNAAFYMFKGDNYWQCVCGWANNNMVSKCQRCKMPKKNAEKYSKDTIEYTYLNYKKNEDEQNAKNRKQRKRMIILVAVFCLFLIIVGFANSFYEDWKLDKHKQEVVDSIQGEYRNSKWMITISGDEVVVTRKTGSEYTGHIKSVENDLLYVDYEKDKKTYPGKLLRKKVGDGYDIQFEYKGEEVTVYSNYEERRTNKIYKQLEKYCAETYWIYDDIDISVDESFLDSIQGEHCVKFLDDSYKMDISDKEMHVDGEYFANEGGMKIIASVYVKERYDRVWVPGTGPDWAFYAIDEDFTVYECFVKYSDGNITITYPSMISLCDY